MNKVMEMSETKDGLALYQCHKRVHAAKITSVVRTRKPALAVTLMLENGRYIVASPEFMKCNKPEAGGYFVRYTDGYESFSPAQAFEEGYTLVQLGHDKEQADLHQHKGSAELTGAPE